jgi:hypothetical protein
VKKTLHIQKSRGIECPVNRPQPVTPDTLIQNVPAG